uniref:Exonuclease domain-containing protein n=1 Tax=Salmo trutta TaxID=8032 RepID=A0A673ZYN4_SALTR
VSMEPQVCLKRKREPSPTPESSKQVKETELNGVPESEHRSGSRPPRLSLPFDRLQEPVTLKDLTELLQFAALGNTGGLKQPSWCRLHHQRKVSGVSVILLEGLSQAHFYRHYLHFKHLRTKYTSRHGYTPSPGNVISGIFSSEVVHNSPADALGDQKSLRWHPVIRKFGLETRGLTGYLLTQEDMIKKHFPVRGMPGSEGFVCTDSDDCVTDSSPLYGLDCEMCLTERGNELTRISLVDSRGSCVLDELVKPPNRILNYLTQFSGITRAMLQPITTTLREVQSKLKKVLPRDAVLVGHSLDNDLRALNLIHPHVIDTSLLYRREFGQRFKLKVLAETVLKKQIQTEERKGHDPTEDAQAALELAQYFIHTGPRQVHDTHTGPRQVHDTHTGPRQVHDTHTGPRQVHDTHTGPRQVHHRHTHTGPRQVHDTHTHTGPRQVHDTHTHTGPRQVHDTHTHTHWTTTGTRHTHTHTGPRQVHDTHTGPRQVHDTHTGPRQVHHRHTHTGPRQVHNTHTHTGPRQVHDTHTHTGPRQVHDTHTHTLDHDRYTTHTHTLDHDRYTTHTHTLDHDRYTTHTHTHTGPRQVHDTHTHTHWTTTGTRHTHTHTLDHDRYTTHTHTLNHDRYTTHTHT